MKKLSLIFIVLFFSSCYRASNVPLENNTPLVFDIIATENSTYYNMYGDLKDSLITFTINTGDSLSLGFSFTSKSGNPANYPFSFYVDSLPDGITTPKDSFAFRLNYVCITTLHINADTGYKTINFKLYNDSLGLHIYPVILHILPTRPAPDCAQCFAVSTSGRNTCAGDSCGITVSLIPGMLHWVNIANVNCLGDSFIVNAYVSCTDGILIPPQTVHGYTIYGRSSVVPCGGYFSFPIYDTLVHSGDTSACIFQIQNF
jgi:hypothetical protein